MNFYSKPLHVAVKTNDFALAEFLLQKGSRVDALATVGMLASTIQETALLIASRIKNRQMIDLLLQYNADPYARNHPAGYITFITAMESNMAIYYAELGYILPVLTWLLLDTLDIVKFRRLGWNWILDFCSGHRLMKN